LQNRYVGDIGDFGKFALLNALVRSDLRLGVVWYLNLAEEANTDGSRIAYDALRSCDEVLFGELNAARRLGRAVVNIENSRILPAGTVYFSKDVSCPVEVRRRRGGAAQHRHEWHSDALNVTTRADVVFLDPDNGLAGRAMQPGSPLSRKYVFLSEIQDYARRGQSVVVYHHQTREKGGIRVQVQKRFDLLQQAVRTANVWAIIFRRQSVRAYFVLTSPRDRDNLFARSAAFVNSKWGRDGHFEMFTNGEPPTPSSDEAAIVIAES
jgi:hypothetical protein